MIRCKKRLITAVLGGSRNNLDKHPSFLQPGKIFQKRYSVSFAEDMKIEKYKGFKAKYTKQGC